MEPSDNLYIDANIQDEQKHDEHVARIKQWKTDQDAIFTRASAGDVESIYRYAVTLWNPYDDDSMEYMKRNSRPWYRRAANAGHIEAMYEYAVYHAPATERSTYLSRAALRGHVKSLYELLYNPPKCLSPEETELYCIALRYVMINRPDTKYLYTRDWVDTWDGLKALQDKYSPNDDSGSG